MIFKSTNTQGFTMLEVIVAIALFVVIIMLSGSMYALSQKAYNKGEVTGELAQNARVSLDRISREIRQSVDIVTDLPPTQNDPGDPPREEIFFQDGHDISQITYLRYFLDSTNLKRRKLVYYCQEEPGTYVTYDSVCGDLGPPEELVLENEDRVVGEYFNNLNFWGADDLIHVSMELAKQQDEFNIQTSIFSRN